MRLETTKEQSVDERQSVPSYLRVHNSSFSPKYSSHNRNFRTLIQSLFNMFTHEEKNESVSIEKKPARLVLVENENETSSLQRLENCANAARESGAYSKYEWMKKTDE